MVILDANIFMLARGENHSFGLRNECSWVTDRERDVPNNSNALS
jgi:hypothetical protein